MKWEERFPDILNSCHFYLQLVNPLKRCFSTFSFCKMNPFKLLFEKKLNSKQQISLIMLWLWHSLINVRYCGATLPKFFHSNYYYFWINWNKKKWTSAGRHMNHHTLQVTHLFVFTESILTLELSSYQLNPSICGKYPTNTPREFIVETTWKFPRRFNLESTWCVCRVITKLYHLKVILTLQK